MQAIVNVEDGVMLLEIEAFSPTGQALVNVGELELEILEPDEFEAVGNDVKPHDLINRFSKVSTHETCVKVWRQDD
jgi:hypothetical protein